jgi:hypothetical protein
MVRRVGRLYVTLVIIASFAVIGPFVGVLIFVGMGIVETSFRHVDRLPELVSTFRTAFLPLLVWGYFYGIAPAAIAGLGNAAVLVSPFRFLDSRTKHALLGLTCGFVGWMSFQIVVLHDLSIWSTFLWIAALAGAACAALVNPWLQPPR